MPLSPIPPPTLYRGTSRWVGFAALTLLLHWAWEVLQGPLYTDYAGMSWAQHAVPCLRAAGGDVVIAALSYGFAAALTRRARWPFEQRRTRPFLLWLAAGLAITVAFELWAVARGRWGYAEAMPVILGVGLSPLLQWLVVPPLSLLLLPRRWRAQSGRR